MRNELEIEFGQFKDEVLNAGRMPPELHPGPKEVHASSAANSVDAESFLIAVCRNQCRSISLIAEPAPDIPAIGGRVYLSRKASEKFPINGSSA
jgi:hypothetical protein